MISYDFGKDELAKQILSPESLRLAYVNITSNDTYDDSQIGDLTHVKSNVDQLIDEVRQMVFRKLNDSTVETTTFSPNLFCVRILCKAIETGLEKSVPSTPTTEKVNYAEHVKRFIAESNVRPRLDVIDLNRCLNSLDKTRQASILLNHFGDKTLGLLVDSFGDTLPYRQSCIHTLAAQIACTQIDRILAQAMPLAKSEYRQHIIGRRLGNEIVIGFDSTPEYAWVFTSLQANLNVELARLGLNIEDIRTQVDCANNRNGFVVFGYFFKVFRRSVLYHPQPVENTEATAKTYMTYSRKLRVLPFKNTSLSRFFLALRKNAGLMFRSTKPSLNIADVRPRLGLSRIVQFPSRLFSSWQYLSLAMLWAIAIVWLYLTILPMRQNLEGEYPVPAMPRGFFLGQINDGTVFEPVHTHYAVYVPPGLRPDDGPFPMIVFLHGLGECTKEAVLTNGLPSAISNRFSGPQENFKFIALFPIDPTGSWDTEINNVYQPDTMRVIDHAIARHHVDRDRIYLTGVSNGGNGVWRFAERYPDMWAAIVPVSSFYQPNASRVKHIPSWIFHGGKDALAPVDRARQAYKDLLNVKADTRYTEFAKYGHRIWGSVYSDDKLYEWLSARKK